MTKPPVQVSAIPTIGSPDIARSETVPLASATMSPLLKPGPVSKPAAKYTSPDAVMEGFPKPNA